MLNAEELYNEAVRLTNSRNFNDAIKIYEQLLSTVENISPPIKAKAYNDLGCIYYAMGDVLRAAEFIKKAILTGFVFEDASRNLMLINSKKVENKLSYKFSLIVPTYNRCDNLKKFIDSVRRNSYYPIELVIVCDPCNDGTIEYLKHETAKGDIILIVNEGHLGSVKSLNKGFSIASGDYLCLLNDDVEVMPGWDLSIVVAIDHDKTFGAGVPLIAQTDGTIVVGGFFLNVRSSYYDWLGKIKYPVTMEDFFNIEGKECDYSFFPIMKRECFKKAGFADEQFEHYFVDPDFGYRIQKAGYKNICCPTSVIIHHDLGIKKAESSNRFEADKARFYQKWGLYKV